MKSSPLDLAILLGALIFGVFLRFAALDIQAPWTDELASLYFAKNLDQVYLTESHAPYYYGLLRLFLGEGITLYGARLFSAFLSLVYLGSYYFIGKKIFKGNQFLLFWVLLCLLPVDIAFARQARHYAWLGEHVLLVAMLVYIKAPLKLLLPTMMMSGFIHPFAAIPNIIFLILKFLEDKRKKEIIYLIIASFIFVLYYVYRIYVFGFDQVGSNLFWNHTSRVDFFLSLPYMFLGDSYPRNLFYPISSYLAWGAFLLTAGYFLIKRSNKLGWIWAILLVFSIVVVEVLSFSGVNFRTARYILYLPYLLVLTVTLIQPHLPKYIVICILGILMGFYVYHQTISPYPWEDQAVARFKQLELENPEVSTLICANIYQADYYAFDKRRLCSYKPDILSIKRGLLFMDFNGDSQLVQFDLLKIMRPILVENFTKGKIILFMPKETQESSK